MRAFTTVLLLLAASPVPAVAQTQGPGISPAAAPTVTARSPRETVQAVAARVRDLYFDPRRAEEIAKGLETAAAAGEFDALTDPRDLATALTMRLKPLDAHFNVVFDPRLGDGPPLRGPGPGPGPQAGPPPDPRPVNPGEARAHYGFRGVQILPGNIGYIDLRQFSEIDFNDPKDPARAAADAALTFIGGTDAVIFDLRDNGGGAPSMVGYLTSAFTPANAPIYNVFHSREGTESEAPEVYHPDPRLTVPVYILISARTGSAGEAFPLYDAGGAPRGDRRRGQRRGGQSRRHGPGRRRLRDLRLHGLAHQCDHRRQLGRHGREAGRRRVLGQGAGQGPDPGPGEDHRR